MRACLKISKPKSGLHTLVFGIDNCFDYTIRVISATLCLIEANFCGQSLAFTGLFG